MTINDLIAEFKITYELGSLGLPGFEDSEIKQLLEINQYKMISQKFGGNNIYNSKFPDTLKRIDDLIGLLKTEYLDLYQTNTNINEYLVLFPAITDYLHTYKVRIKTTGGVFDLAEPVQLKESTRFSSGFRNTNPALRNPKYTIASNNSGERILLVYYFKSSESVILLSGGCEFTYIIKPTNLTIEGGGTTLTNFNDDVYHELVAMTVDHAIDIATPGKSQISKQQLNKIE